MSFPKDNWRKLIFHHLKRQIKNVRTVSVWAGTFSDLMRYQGRPLPKVLLSESHRAFGRVVVKPMPQKYSA